MATPPSPRGRGESATDYASRLETSSPELVWGPGFDSDDNEPTVIPGVGTFQRTFDPAAERAATLAESAARSARERTFTPSEINPTRTQTQIELDAQRLRERATNVPLEQQLRERLIGAGIGAIVPVGGMLYGMSNALNRSQERRIADQLLQQDEYKGGLFGTGFLAGPQASSYVPVYDENDNLVGSVGVNAEGQPMRYTGPRIEDYTGFGAELVTRDPFADMNMGEGGDEAAPMAMPPAPTPAAPAQPPAGQIPSVPLPTAFVGQQPAMPMQRPTLSPMTQATPVQPMQPFRPGAPAPQGIMSAPQALRPSYINIGRQNPLNQ